MSQVITPTVGRVVWYYPGVTDSFAKPAPGQPLPAIVTVTWSDTYVNLAIFDANGRPVADPPTSVLLVQPGAERPTGGRFCEWMPHQIGQAAKHAAG